MSRDMDSPKKLGSSYRFYALSRAKLFSVAFGPHVLTFNPWAGFFPFPPPAPRGGEGGGGLVFGPNQRRQGKVWLSPPFFFPKRGRDKKKREAGMVAHFSPCVFAFAPPFLKKRGRGNHDHFSQTCYKEKRSLSKAPTVILEVVCVTAK